MVYRHKKIVTTPEDFTTRADKLSEEGWELVSVINDPDKSVIYIFGFFRREKEKN